MNTIKKTIISLFVSTLLATASTMAFAEEAAKPAEAAKSASQGIAETISHLEEGLTLAAKSDFSAATLHLKAARNSAAEITGHALDVHKGVTHINLGMKEVKLGHPEQATAEIETALKTFKAL